MKKKVVMLLLALACISLSACQKTADVIEETVEMETGSSEVVEEETTEEETTEVETVAEEVTEESLEELNGDIAVEEINESDADFEPLVRYATTNINVREGASKDTAKVGEFAVNAEVLVYGVDGEWSKVSDANKTVQGYVKTSLLSDYMVNVKAEAPKKENNGGNGQANASANGASQNSGQQAQAATPTPQQQSQASNSSRPVGGTQSMQDWLRETAEMGGNEVYDEYSVLPSQPNDGTLPDWALQQEWNVE